MDRGDLPTPHPQLEVHRDGVLIAILDIANDVTPLRRGVRRRRVAHLSGSSANTIGSPADGVRDEDWVVDAFVAENLFGPSQDADAKLLRQEPPKRAGGSVSA